LACAILTNHPDWGFDAEKVATVFHKASLPVPGSRKAAEAAQQQLCAALKDLVEGESAENADEKDPATTDHVASADLSERSYFKVAIAKSMVLDKANHHVKMQMWEAFPVVVSRMSVCAYSPEAVASYDCTGCDGDKENSAPKNENAQAQGQKSGDATPALAKPALAKPQQCECCTSPVGFSATKVHAGGKSFEVFVCDNCGNVDDPKSAEKDPVRSPPHTDLQYTPGLVTGTLPAGMLIPIGGTVFIVNDKPAPGSHKPGFGYFIDSLFSQQKRVRGKPSAMRASLQKVEFGLNPWTYRHEGPVHWPQVQVIFGQKTNEQLAKMEHPLTAVLAYEKFVFTIPDLGCAKELDSDAQSQATTSESSSSSSHETAAPAEPVGEPLTTEEASILDEEDDTEKKKKKKKREEKKMTEPEKLKATCGADAAYSEPKVKVTLWIPHFKLVRDVKKAST